MLECQDSLAISIFHQMQKKTTKIVTKRNLKRPCKNQSWCQVPNCTKAKTKTATKKATKATTKTATKKETKRPRKNPTLVQAQNCNQDSAQKKDQDNKKYSNQSCKKNRNHNDHACFYGHGPAWDNRHWRGWKPRNTPRIQAPRTLVPATTSLSGIKPLSWGPKMRSEKRTKN